MSIQDSQQTLENTASSAPVQPEGSSGQKCLFCNGREFKRSRLHLTDLSTLLQLKVPARCVRCGQLQAISFWAAKDALPAGKRSGPTHEVTIPQPVQPMQQSQPVRQVQPVQPPKPLQPLAPVVSSDSGQQQLPVADPNSRDAVPHAVLMDVLDIRCQYCPAQAFRRSKLRLQDLFLILLMRYSARCLRCGQRQTVNFMVAASGVPSSYKQARNMRNTETWGEYTAAGVAPAPRVGAVKPLSAVVGQVYTLKDIPVGTETPLTSIVSDVYAARAREIKVEAAEPEKRPMKKPADDQSIW